MLRQLNGTYRWFHFITCAIMVTLNTSVRGDPPVVPEALSVVATAAECGLTPESLVVADLQASASLVIGRLEASHSLRQLLALRLSDLDAAALANELAVRTLQANPSDAQAAAAHTASITNLNLARAALEETRSAVVAAATDGLAPASLTRLANWRSGHEAAVPEEFRVLARTPQQWSDIHGALRAERRAQRLDEDPDPAHASLLSNIRADIEVTAASMRLAQHLESVRAVFAAVSGST